MAKQDEAAQQPGPSPAKTTQGPAEQSWRGRAGVSKAPAQSTEEALGENPLKNPVDPKPRTPLSSWKMSGRTRHRAPRPQTHDRTAQKKRDRLARLRENGRKGGQKVARLYGEEFFQERARRGRVSCLMRYGKGFYQSILAGWRAERALAKAKERRDEAE